MWAGIFEAFLYTVSVLVGRHWIFAFWLTLVASVLGGWHFGRSQFVVKNPPGEVTRTPLSRFSKSAFAADSPKNQWARRVKNATTANFPRLLEEWKTLFPETNDGIHGPQENALRWLLAQWLMKDREGFVKAVTDKEFKSKHQAALVIARLNPEMIDALRQFRTEMSGDGSRQREVESDLIRSICGCYSAESCLRTAKLWIAEPNGGGDDEIFKRLAERSAAIDPDKAEAALSSLPEAARAAFAAEIVKRLPPEDVARRIALLSQLTPLQWDRDLGESLGEQGADYADAIFKLPGATTSEAQPHFMAAWVENDPGAALHWFSSLPEDDAFGPAASGLIGTWASFDQSSALAWAESLVNGPFRQAVSPYVASVLAEEKPREAWRWAASITDHEARAEAYEEISSSHRDGAPAEFNKERLAALRAAGRE
jgi:hypothetical protein